MVKDLANIANLKETLDYLKIRQKNLTNEISLLEILLERFEKS